MAVRGRKASPTNERRNTHASSAEWVDVPDEPFQGCPLELPQSRTIVTRDGQESVQLLPVTREWWAVVSTMPHCVLWTDGDWQFALMSAFTADAAFCGIASASTELRNREKVLGTTVEFRRQLKIRYVEVEKPKAASDVTNIDDYRAL